MISVNNFKHMEFKISLCINHIEMSEEIEDGFDQGISKRNY